MNNEVNQLTIVTTTYNCRQHIEEYVSAISSLDTKIFDWIIIDAGSTDGTKEYLTEKIHCFTHFSVQPDSGVYFGLNNALKHIKTKYYMVFGADDRPSPDLISELKPFLAEDYSLILGSVRTLPSNRVKTTGSRKMHWISWGRTISHHSVGTVIKRDVHDRFGIYDIDYSICADGKLIKAILKSSEPIVFTNRIFGDFRLGGISSQNKMRSIIELFLIQVQARENIVVQLILLNCRVLQCAAAGCKSRLVERTRKN